MIQMIHVIQIIQIIGIRKMVDRIETMDIIATHEAKLTSFKIYVDHSTSISIIPFVPITSIISIIPIVPIIFNYSNYINCVSLRVLRLFQLRRLFHRIKVINNSPHKKWNRPISSIIPNISSISITSIISPTGA